MRIEMRAGGLMGTLNVAMYQATFNSFSNSSTKVKDDFDRVVSSFYSLNGGVGNLQSAVSLIQQRVRQESQKQENIQTTRQETNSFLSETVATDRKVAAIVDKNNDDFYEVNSHLKPDSLINIRIDEDIFELLETSENAMTAAQKCAQAIVAINKYYVENGTYSTDGILRYGSDQGRPAALSDNDGRTTKREKEFLDIIKQNKNKDMTDKELDEYLDKLNHEGCGYASIVNSVFEYYENAENGEELFRKKFGFDMKRSDGTMNFELLLVYVYSKYDDPKSKGLSQKDEEKLLKKVMAEKGSDGNGKVKVKTNSYKDISNDKIEQYLSEGKQVIISSQSVVLYNMDGSVLQNCAGAGHSLSVTGVTSDGKIIVSSWGHLCYIDRKDDGKFQHRWKSYPDDAWFSFGWMDLQFTVVEYD